MDIIKNKRKMLILVVMTLTLMVSITGATYAFFAISATNTTTITGTTAQVESDLIVTKILPTSNNAGTGVMVPQYSVNLSTHANALRSAITGGCVDANSNVACQVYEIKFQNQSTGSIRTSASLTLTSEMTNLKWYTIASGTNVASVPNSVTYTYPSDLTQSYGNAKSTTTLSGSALLGANNYHYWYVVVWIEETGTDQYGVDGNKTFTGRVDVQAVDGSGNAIQGLTSTFTG